MAFKPLCASIDHVERLGHVDVGTRLPELVFQAPSDVLVLIHTLLARSYIGDPALVPQQESLINTFQNIYRRYGFGD